MASGTWNRREDETTRAWQAFQHYRDAGAGRSHSRTAQTITTDIRQVERWSTKYSWVNRCAAWDGFLDEAIQQKSTSRVLEMADRHARLSRNAQAVLTLPMVELQRRIEAGHIEWGKLGDVDLIAMVAAATRALDTMFKSERLSVGEPSEYVRTDGDLAGGDIVALLRQAMEEHGTA